MTEERPEFADLESALDLMAEADGAESSGLEDRVFAATRATLSGDQAPTVVARIGWSRMRAAAAIGIVGVTALVAAMLSQKTAVAPATDPALATVESHALDAVDAWLSGSPLGDRESALDDLSIAIVEFEPRSAGDWMNENLLISEGDSL